MVSLLLVVLAAPPKVTKVVLYADRAQVTRAVEVDCGTGTATARFADLQPTFEAQSLTASIVGGASQGLDGAARVEGLSVSERRDKASRDERLKQLEAKLLDNEVKAQLQRRAVERALASRAQAESLRSGLEPFLNRDAASERKPDVTSWRAALDSALGLIDDANAKVLQAQSALRTLERESAELSAARGRLDAGAPDKVEDVDVAVACAKPGKVRVELSSLVPGAGWTPVYQARADEAKAAVALTVAGDVHQGTGEDWSGVEVTLSTSVSRRESTPPEPQRLYLGAGPPEAERKVLVARAEEASGLVTDGDRQGGEVARGPSAPKAEEQGLSVQLKVPAKADISGDGRAARVVVETVTLPATFSRVAVPKLTPHVFRVAKVRNQARYPLLPGMVELFTGASFLGAAAFERAAQDAPFELAFGVDETLKVKRTVLAEDRRDAGLFGNKRRFSYGYKVELASFSAAPVTVVLKEHVPVIELDDVELRIEGTTTAGYQTSGTDGILAWNVALTPKAHQVVELHFVVDVPAKYDSSGL